MTTDERHRHDADSEPTATAGGTMRARRWAIAASFRDPADYDIPPLPDWTVHRSTDGALAFGADGEVFIRADNPTKVRR